MFKTKKIIGFVFISLLLWLSVSFTDAAKLYLAPSTGTFIYNCPFDVDVMLDMEGKDTTAMDLKIMVDESRYVIMNFDGQGGMFRTYTKPKYLKVRGWAYQGLNTVYVFLSTFAPPQWVVWWGKIGTLTIKPNPWVWELPLNFFFEEWSEWADSNVPVLSGNHLVDALTRVENWYYNLAEGPCTYHGVATGYMVESAGTPFEVVKNEIVVKWQQPGTITNLIRQYGRYLILLMIIAVLIIILKKKHRKK